jgi:hypothetical protein
MPSGDQVTQFRLAIPEEGGASSPSPRLRLGPVAAPACHALAKGDPVLVRGHLIRRFYRDGGGGRSVTEVVATEVKKLEPVEE